MARHLPDEGVAVGRYTVRRLRKEQGGGQGSLATPAADDRQPSWLWSGAASAGAAVCCRPPPCGLVWRRDLSVDRRRLVIAVGAGGRVVKESGGVGHA